MGMKKLKKAAMIAAASMFVMMMPMIQTHAAPTDVIENNESGIPDKTLYQNILKVLGKQSTDTFIVCKRNENPKTGAYSTGIYKQRKDGERE